MSSSEKLEKLYALFERAGSEGERQAAAAAIERIKSKAEYKSPDQEWTWTFPDMGASQLFRSVCKKYGLRVYRYKRQKYTTVTVMMNESMKDMVESDYEDLYDEWSSLTTDILIELIERFEAGDIEHIEDSPTEDKGD